jgi:hypothetical protein
MSPQLSPDSNTSWRGIDVDGYISALVTVDVAAIAGRHTVPLPFGRHSYHRDRYSRVPLKSEQTRPFCDVT